MGVEELVEFPASAVENQDVAVARAPGSAFDWGIARDGVRAGITFIGVLETDRYLFLFAVDDHVRNSAGRAIWDRVESAGALTSGLDIWLSLRSRATPSLPNSSPACCCIA